MAHLLNVITRFAPVWFFHQKENWFPMSVLTYISQCDLHVPNVPPMSTENFASWVENADISVQENSTLKWKSEGGPMPLVFDPHHPVYYTVYNPTERDTYITYYLFLANNPASKFICGCDVPYTGHWADIENVQVHLQDNLLKRVYYSKHGDGNWVPVEKLQVDPITKRPYVFVSLNSHACYENNGFHGFHCRFGMLVPDRTSNSAFRSDSTNLFPIEGVLMYRGTYGDNSVSGFPSKSSWMKEERDKPWRY